MCEILRTFRVSVNLTGSAPQNTDTSNHSVLTTTALQAKEEIRLPIPKRYPIVTDYTHTGALPAPLLFDGTFGRAVVETDEEH